MKRKCRILLIFVVIGLISVGVFFCLLAYNKHKSRNKAIYATSIQFIEGARNYEVCIDNSIILTKDIITTTPFNYSLDIIFEVEKVYNPNEIPPVEIELDVPFNFSTTGKYRITCKAISGPEKDNVITDYIYISVVAEPTSTTTMYIKDKQASITVGETLNLDKIVNIAKPAIAEMSITCNENISCANNKVTAINKGAGKLDIKLKYYNLIICDTVVINIKPIIEASDLSLSVIYGKNTYTNNDIITITKSNYSINLNYIINNCENQEVICWSDNGLQIVSTFSSLIIVNASSIGEFNVFISPKDYPDIVFKIVLDIIE